LVFHTEFDHKVVSRDRGQLTTTAAAYSWTSLGSGRFSCHLFDHGWV